MECALTQTSYYSSVTRLQGGTISSGLICFPHYY